MLVSSPAYAWRGARARALAKALGSAPGPTAFSAATLRARRPPLCALYRGGLLLSCSTSSLKTNQLVLVAENIEVAVIDYRRPVGFCDLFFGRQVDAGVGHDLFYGRGVAVIKERQHHRTLGDPVARLAADDPPTPGDHTSDMLVVLGGVGAAQQALGTLPCVYATATPLGWCGMPRVALCRYLLAVGPDIEHRVRP